MLKADLHVHSHYSLDSNMPLEKIIYRCKKNGINCIALCDHGTIEGALKMRDIAPFKVIIAEEILTPYGEIMGMFLKKTIPSGLSVKETIAQIRAQEGLVCVPHPFDRFRNSALRPHIIEEIADQIDILETFNARSFPLQDLTRAKTFALKHGIIQSAGSDAHTPYEIGNAYVEIPKFNGKEDFLSALKTGKIIGHRTNPIIHAISIWTKLRKRCWE